MKYVFTSQKVALQFGAVFGVSLGILQSVLNGAVLTRSTILLPILFYILLALACLFAGLFATKRTGQVSTGALAGFCASIIGTITRSLITWHVVAAYGTMNSWSAPQYTLLMLSVMIILSLCLLVGLGFGFEALGGLIGKRMSPLTLNNHTRLIH